MTQPQILTAEYDSGAYPVAPVAADLALEASTTEGAALMMIHAAWQMVETFTKRHFRAVVGGKVFVRTTGPEVCTLPLWPFPEMVACHVQHGGGWEPEPSTYLPEIGQIDLEGWATYRLTIPEIPAPTLKPNVVQAVHNLALYLLIHDPARREFRSQSAGDSSFTREGMMGALYGSGAGALLAGEIRL